jgi:hypothetical protein
VSERERRTPLRTNSTWASWLHAGVGGMLMGRVPPRCTVVCLARAVALSVWGPGAYKWGRPGRHFNDHCDIYGIVIRYFSISVSIFPYLGCVLLPRRDLCSNTRGQFRPPTHLKRSVRLDPPTPPARAAGRGGNAEYENAFHCQLWWRGACVRGPSGSHHLGAH